MNWTSAILTLILLLNIAVSDGDVSCESPQYLERGKRGLVDCGFPESYYGIFWYNTTEYSQVDPIAYVKGTTEVGGTGYQSDEYYIAPNGSLIITKVSIEDDKNFTAIVLDSPRDNYSPNDIRVIVTVKPYQMQPHINGCNPEEQFCFKVMKNSSELSCSVRGARPSVDLGWYMKTISTDYLLNSEINVTFENLLYNTFVKTMYNDNIYRTVLYVCKSVSHPVLLKNEFSFVLIRNGLKKFEQIEPTKMYAQHSTSIDLPCTHRDVLYLVWRKTVPTNYSEDLIHMVSFDNALFKKSYSHKYLLENQSERSLRIKELDITDDGLYTCTFGDGISENAVGFILQVYVTPDPGDPIVEGCNDGRYCSLIVPKTGELKCSVRRIRPKVKLQWETIKDKHKLVINFSGDSYEVEENGWNYDITVKSNFSIEKSYPGIIPIRCRALDLGEIPFDISRNVYLIPMKDESQEAVTSTEGRVLGGHFWGWLFFSIIISALATLAAVSVILNVMKRRRRNRQFYEAIPMIRRERPSEEKIRIFKEELTTKYSNTWERFHPLPYDKTVSYAMNDLFVEGEIEHLENVTTESYGKFCMRQKLENHNDFLKSLWQRQSETVLEGEPGFGKTTLGYQLAFDWATKNPSSPLKDIDIYILLRLRYLKDVLSIPAAIKHFLLPGNSTLTIQDISNILYHSQSVVIFLDGYNRFSQNKNKKLVFLKDVRTNNICSKCQVIVTTKPFLLTDEETKDMIRMRLTGFGEISWRNYLKKSVARNNRAEEERIMNIIYSNPLLRDLCQVPLFFVLFVHITTKHGNFARQKDHVDGDDADNDDDTHNNTDDDTKIDTVTNFFQTIIDRFQSELNTKTANDHSALRSVCFDGLCDAEEGLIWKKERLCNRLGQTLYQEYLRVGLVVEKEFCRYKGNSQTQNRGKVYYETKVRFPHDVFCEWFAAKKLAQVLKNTSQKECIKIFEKINPFDHQYVYRFACAFDVEAARKIIKYLQNLKDGEKFAILCILEQPEDNWNVENTISNICSSPIVITSSDGLFLQRSTVQVLEFASDKNIKIECVWLGKTNSSFDVNKASLELSSGIILPKLSTLSQLSISDPGREVSKDDLIGFLEYVSLCHSLKDLRFRACLLPFSPLEDTDKTKSIIGKKPVDVQWKIPVLERNWYTLDIQSGKWCHKNQTMSKEKYDEVVLSFGASFKTGHSMNDFSDNPGACASSPAQSNNQVKRHEVGEKTTKADTAQAGPSTL